jgi:hypothetical protein
MPYNARHRFKINSDNGTVSSVGEDSGGGYGKYAGTVAANGNCLYGIPDESNRIVRFDPLSQARSFCGRRS